MSGLFSRITRRSRSSADETRELQPIVDRPMQPVDAPANETSPLAEQDEVASPSSAGADSTTVSRGLDRGRARRRLRYLRKVRELQLRDLGGLVFDLHRFDRQRPDLVESKLEQLAETDRELRGLEAAVSTMRTGREIREPGIGGTCQACGALHGSADRFCAACGTPVVRPR